MQHCYCHYVQSLHQSRYPSDWFTAPHMFQPKETGLLMSCATQTGWRHRLWKTNPWKKKKKTKEKANVKTATSDDISCKTSSSVASHLVWESCGYVCESRMNFVYEIDVGQGLGLCTQRLNDRTLEGWHISQAEQTNTHLCTHTHTCIKQLCITQPAPSLSHNLALETQQELGNGGFDQVRSPRHFVTLRLQFGLHGLAQFSVSEKGVCVKPYSL